MDIEAVLATLPFIAFSLFVTGCSIWGWTNMGKNFKNAQAKWKGWPILGSLCLVVFWTMFILMATDTLMVSTGMVIFGLAVPLAFSVFFHAGFVYDDLT